jgi:hypothetical protein
MTDKEKELFAKLFYSGLKVKSLFVQAQGLLTFWLCHHKIILCESKCKKIEIRLERTQVRLLHLA